MFVCKECFNEKLYLCKTCYEKDREKSESVFEDSVRAFLADGMIDNQEFSQLEKLSEELKIDDKRKSEIINKNRNLSDNSQLNETEKFEFDKACESFEKGDFNTSINHIDKIFNSHKNNTDIVSLKLVATAEANPDLIDAVADEFKYDFPQKTASLIIAFLNRKDLINAEKHLKEGKRNWPNNNLIICCELMFINQISKIYSKPKDNKLYKTLLDSIPEDSINTVERFYLRKVNNYYLKQGDKLLFNNQAFEEGVVSDNSFIREFDSYCSVKKFNLFKSNKGS